MTLAPPIAGPSPSLFAAALALALARPALAADDAPAYDGGIGEEEAALEEPIYETVVIGAAPEDEGLSREKITRAEIRRSGAATAVEALEREPAVHAGTGRRGERIITLRGFEQRGVAVYLDGVPFAVPYDGQLDLGKLPISLVDHITVIKGPSSIANGPGGLGGTVNVVTRDPAGAPFAETAAEAGAHDAAKIDAFHALDRDGFGYALGAGLSQRDGWELPASFGATRTEDGGLRENSRRRSGYAGGKLVLEPAAGHRVELQPFGVAGEFGVPPSTVDSYPRYWRFGVWRAGVVQVSHAYAGPRLDVEEAAYAGAFDNRLDSYDDATYATMDSPRAFRSWYRDRTWGGRVRGEARFPLPWEGDLALRLWLGASGETHRSTLVGAGEDETYGRALLTLVPELELPLPHRLTATASVQADLEVTDASGGADPATPGVGPFVSLRWDPLDAIMLRLVGARRCRIPTLRERYSSAMGSSEPNPDLRPEVAYHVGLDASWAPSRYVAFEASGFDAEVVDLIERVAIGSGLERQTNIGRARLAGFEAAIDVTVERWLGARLGYAFLHARRLDEDPPDDALEYRPGHQAFAELSSAPIAWLELSTGLEVVGSQAFQDRQLLGWGELGPYAVWGARAAALPSENVEIWIRATNLLDASYQTEYGYPDPGREIWVGLRLSLD